MDIQDSIRVIVDLKGQSETGFNYVPVMVVAISSVISLVIAYVTSIFTRKSELDKIKSAHEILEKTVNNELRGKLLTIESANYKIMYEKKLKALKKIKEIQYTMLEEDRKDFGISYEFTQAFPYEEFMASVHDLIINYSYVFENEQLADSLKNIYDDTDSTYCNRDYKSTEWCDFNNRIYEKFQKIITLINTDMTEHYYNIGTKSN
jgi:hypothetical protein